MKKLLTSGLIILFFLITGNAVHSQTLKINGHLNFGVSQIVTSIQRGGDDLKVDLVPSGSIGFSVDRDISLRSSFGAGLLFVQLESKESFGGVVMGVSGIVGEFSSETEIHASYLAFPISYKLRFDQIGFTVGVQPMRLLGSSAINSSEGILFDEPFEDEVEVTTADVVFDKIDFGVRAGLSYQLSEALSVQAEVYYGLSDITARDFPFRRSNQQVTIGASYTLKTID